ncbi:uncharacterized protein LOC128554820 [Mercenaria mercenaria]|uniref:uncharacterized protein LOC128554820 n=1 Tax=Mercenaria mercenaria TaxID=6596 RepID=UPI00234FA4FE|nr:uncharacterized protein LOC128554820 [Mercenaria mercenaria]
MSQFSNNIKIKTETNQDRMSQISDYTHNVSLRLSQVLDEIGVNERIVLKRRRLRLLRETLFTIPYQLRTYNTSVYCFGSQTESTTTPGLQSDFDCLYSINNFNIITDWSEWEPGVKNLLMIQDETVSPGYCLLQHLRDDAPLPYNDVLNEDFYRDRRGRVLLKNTLINVAYEEGRVRHGPALSEQEVPGVYDLDIVFALPCKSWPVQANHWLDEQGVGGWPTEEMRRYCSSTGCFVVAVGNKGSGNRELEWRISTSLTERCLMFNLNITQVRCYVLMKMILKTFISSQYPESISSFMCKTVLLHCIANTQSNAWRENTLLTCLTLCLSTLYDCVLNEVCPHFIIPDNNLMAERFLPHIKPFILDTLQYVASSNGRALLEIDCDRLGLRLQMKNNGICVIDPQTIPTFISGQLFKDVALDIAHVNKMLLSETNNSFNIPAVLQLLSTCMFKHVYKYLDANQKQDKIAGSVTAQQLCKTLGSVLASSNIYHQGNISMETLTWLSFGLNSDVSSGKLKLASIFYCMEDTERTDMIVKDTEECYDLSVVEAVCACHNFEHQDKRSAFNRLSFQQNEEHVLVKHITAFCVIFLPCEINCCPYELQHEMFRSTQEDLAYRRKYDYWMDWAVVDSLPYLYFLQYKTCNSLRRHDDKKRALSNLVRAIDEEANLGHRETALNLLGQCMEQENRSTDALRCYLLSVQIRERNNAAKLHICILLNTLINH